MIDHATRLSASTVITSKKPDINISKIFQVWISVYGLPEKFLSDNSGEFANDHFTNMCEAMNINFKLTSTESPSSNSLIERHNLILGDILERILEESTNNIDIEVAWAINAKKLPNKCSWFFTISTGSQSKPYFTLCCHKQTTSSHTYPNQQNSRRKFMLSPQVKTGTH